MDIAELAQKNSPSIDTLPFYINLSNEGVLIMEGTVEALSRYKFETGLSGLQ